MSVIYGIRTFVPRMLAHGEPGHVVNTCSMTSVIAASNMYGICKHAILALTEVLAADLLAAGLGDRGDRAVPGDHRDQPVPRVAEPACRSDGRRLGDVVVGGGAARAHALGAVVRDAAVGGGGSLLVDAVRANQLYLLTDHEWDSRVIARHEAILAGAVGPAATGILDQEGVR